MSRWTAADLPDLSGTTALVTGGNSGIGLETARGLAEHGAEVVLACRDTAAGEAAAARLPGRTRVERLDLASLDSVAALAQRWEGPLDLLVNNAGVMNPPKRRTTVDGFELMYGTNHVGHVALTARLLPALLAAPAPRVVTVASIAHHGGDASVLEGNPEAGYVPERCYGNTKLANLLFGLDLHRRATAAGSPLVSTMAHPGISATGLVADPNGMGANPVVRRLAPYVMPIVFQSARAGAEPTLYAATAAAPGSYTGPQWLRETRGPAGPARLSRFARDADLAARLWDLTLEQAGVSFPF